MATLKIDGEAIKQVFYMIPKNPLPTTPTIDLPASKLSDCCGDFSLKALADTGSSDQFKNDVSGFIWWFDPVIDTALLELYKFENGAWVKKDDLDSATYGTYYTYGFFTNDAGEKFVGYQLEWKEVLDAFDAGSYKVACLVTSAIGGDATLYSYEYCLKQYTPDAANGTILIEYNINHLMGISTNDLVKKDFGTLNWYNSLRVPGYFGFPSSQYEKDYVQYENGQRVWVSDEQEPEYTLKTKPIPAFLHDILRTDVVQADVVLITDYNSKNAASWVQKAVQCTSGYEPDWKVLQSKLSKIELKFRQEYNNLKKLRC